MQKTALLCTSFRPQASIRTADRQARPPPAAIAVAPYRRNAVWMRLTYKSRLLENMEIQNRSLYVLYVIVSCLVPVTAVQ